MTEQQPYTVVERRGEVEIRRYPEHTVAEVVVEGEFDRAGNRGFRPLFGYIQQGGIAMTAPVVQTPGAEGNAVAFVMPEGRTAETLPRPGDPDVHLRTIPERTAAAVRFSGWGNAGDLERRGSRLVQALAGSGWTPVGPVRLARFNAPFVPPFLRHNEVVVDVTRT
jgi:effector-binding domain-containing protein